MRQSGTARDWLGSLRVRLAGAMLLMLVAALALSSALDSLDTAGEQATRGVLGALQREPYQDGLVLASFGLAVGVLIWVVSAWSLAPLSRASREAAAAGPGHPGVRISADRLPTEMRPLVAAVNAALDRLEAAYAAERQFTADAAHELRTPLAVLTLRLQRAREPACAGSAADHGLDEGLDHDGIDRDLNHMTRLVAQLLDLARKQAAQRRPGAEQRTVNLCRIAREAAATVLPLAEAARRRLVLDLPDTMTMEGRADDLRDMLVNVLENALVHGQGTVRMTGRLEGGRLLLDVADEGPGVPEMLRQTVFERFRKAHQGSAGTGLGLAIVREVAAGHGGSAAFQPGPACVVRIELPHAGG